MTDSKFTNVASLVSRVMNFARQAMQGLQDGAMVALGAVGIGFAYVVSLMLVRIAPEGANRTDHISRTTEGDVQPPVIRPHDDRIIRFVVFLYKRSRIRKHLLQNYKSRCRFIPSCSDYSIRAVRKYGLIRGLALTGARLKRCNPRYSGDYVDFP